MTSSPILRTNYEDGPETSLLGRCKVVVSSRKHAFYTIVRSIGKYRSISFGLRRFLALRKKIFEREKGLAEPDEKYFAGIAQVDYTFKFLFRGYCKRRLARPRKKAQFSVPS